MKRYLFTTLLITALLFAGCSSIPKQPSPQKGSTPTEIIIPKSDPAKDRGSDDMERLD